MRKKYPSIEIILNNSSRDYNLIPLVKETRDFFPGFKIPFYLEAYGKKFNVHITSASGGKRRNDPSIGDPRIGQYIVGNLKEFYEAHPEVGGGSRLKIEMTKPFEYYRICQIL